MTDNQAFGDEWNAYVKAFAPVVRADTVVEGIYRDQDDDKFLTTALSARVDYVVSGDHDVRVLEQCQDVKIRLLREFADLLARAHARGS